MAIGTIKTLLYNKGFGFIAPNDASGQDSDLFFHQSSVTEANFERLKEGQRVRFDEEPDPRNASRRRASNVTLVSE
jgi:CspA family cold shock protein